MPATSIDVLFGNRTIKNVSYRGAANEVDHIPAPVTARLSDQSQREVKSFSQESYARNKSFMQRFETQEPQKYREFTQMLFEKKQVAQAELEMAQASQSLPSAKR